jgi:hypothetical protein
MKRVLRDKRGSLAKGYSAKDRAKLDRLVEEASPAKSNRH